METRFYQASSSEMFGAAPPPQSESTPFHPRSPYAVAKVMVYFRPVNVGTGVETRIRDLAELTRGVTGYEGEVTRDASRPDGQPSRYLDVSWARADGLLGGDAAGGVSAPHERELPRRLRVGGHGLTLRTWPARADFAARVFS